MLQGLNDYRLNSHQQVDSITQRPLSAYFSICTAGGTGGYRVPHTFTFIYLVTDLFKETE